MALTTDDIRLAAERLHQAENRFGSCRSIIPATRFK
jgi:hypothetical protein